jgi:predicted GNAT superfamily acetyltransferase
MRDQKLCIQELTTIEQFHQCEELQRQAWHMPDATDIVPLHLLITFRKSGGLVLGAFAEGGTMVGFLVGFLGFKSRDGQELKHCSHMMGVLEGWRGRGVGYRLKLAQRRYALAQGLDLVTWTYDPLESLNAALNIAKLGAVCRTYVRNLYGFMTDVLNAGVPTDRFQVEWRIASEHVAKRLDGERAWTGLASALEAGAVLLNPAVVGRQGLVEPRDATSSPSGDVVVIEIPADMRRIKTAGIELAQRWREQTRELFEGCFEAGYVTTDFISEMTPAAETGGELRRSYYVLQREGGAER